MKLHITRGYQSCRSAYLWMPVLASVMFASAQAAPVSEWRDQLVPPVFKAAEITDQPVLTILQHDIERLRHNRSVINTPLKIGDQAYEQGLGTHANSRLRILSNDPIVRFTASVGVDNNHNTGGELGTVVFSVSTGDQQLWQSPVMHGGESAEQVELDCPQVRVLDLVAGDADDNQYYDHADWADAEIVTAGGKTWRVSDLEVKSGLKSPIPFSFQYDGQPSRQLLPQWDHQVTTQSGDDAVREAHVWTDPQTGLKVICTVVRYTDFPAVEWLLHFENVGQADTKIVSDVNTLDLFFGMPRNEDPAYLLYRTHGGVPNPRHFEPSREKIGRQPIVFGPGHGRSSADNFPFFKVDTGRGSAVIAVGWSGCWKASAVSWDQRGMQMAAGLDLTHFRLHPGEKVRMPRMLALFWSGDTWEANAQFRQLIYKHYVALREGKPILPMLFCNTCFTRGGGWLNECNAENQISLINAYAPLGLEALLTDAGWFRGGWPNGAGNWDPRKDAYPQGMGPVAAAAKKKGMIYGLWYEPERVMAGTDVHQKHPEWLLKRQEAPDHGYLLNFALPEVQDYFFNIVADFMKLPGFRFYRQDFNMDPLPYWRFTDAPDRQGIAEMKYIEGLYAYWDRILDTWPDAVLEECASGGNRIDLETVMRMHLHQKTDYWFDNVVDQNSLWGVSQYLPNSTIVAHLNRMDDYSFHSTMASSLCLGWIADATDFDYARARKLTDRYMEVRHLLVGAWYPVLDYSRDASDWTGSQFHRPDLDEGMLLIFRHDESPYPQAELRLRGLDAEKTYVFTSDRSGPLGELTGAQLRDEGLLAKLPQRPLSDLIVYKAK